MMTIKLNYDIPSPEQRNDLVHDIVSEIGEDNLNDKALEIMADYLVFCMEKEEKKKREILTDNRMTTVNKRESSLEGLTAKLENGEDGLYNLIANDKNIILTPSVSITKQDLDEIPMLRQLREAIHEVEKIPAEGKDAYKKKKMLIELRQDQYIIKNAYRRPIYFLRAVKGTPVINWDNNTGYEDADGKYVEVSENRLDLKNYEHVSAVLCNYSLLKQKTADELNNDIKYVVEDLENVIESFLPQKYPMYHDIIIWKVDGKSNLEIQKLLQEKYGSTHSQEYISSLFRNKIPKVIADAVKEQWLLWFYTNKAKGNWKTCSRCGETKLAHNRYFSKNKTAKSGWYSICKACRNKK
jgi:hypothetical protein